MHASQLRNKEPLLRALGMAGADGGPSPGSRRKLMQVEGILPWLLAAVSSAPSFPRSIIEFGCGKGYLSFFLAEALRAMSMRPAKILGVDRNLDLVDRCRRIRDVLGWGELDFAVATCEEFVVSAAPLLVTSLHACDVATDHVLAAGIHLGAEHIIAAPCCHFTTQRELREAGHRHDWGYLARSFPLLGGRLSEVITDGMRCLCLRGHGYDVQVREFVSGTATPKNVLLIARRAGLRGDRALRELRRLERAIGVSCAALVSLARRRADGIGSAH